MSFSLQESLLTEHLTFAPLSLVDDIINTANAQLYQSVNVLEERLTSLPAGVIPDDEIETGIHKFETLLENAVDRNFDALELFVLRNIVNIPDDLLAWVQLKHHAGLEFSADESADIEEDIHKARKTYHASRKVQAMIVRERRANDRRLALLDTHTATLAFLETAAHEHDINDMVQSSSLLQDSMMQLQDMLNSANALSNVLNLGLDADPRSRYIEEVLSNTIQEGTFEQNVAEVNLLGGEHDIEHVTSLLQDKPS